MFNSTVRLGGSPEGSEYMKVDVDIQTVSILLKSDAGDTAGIIRVSLDSDSVHVYVNAVRDNYELKPRGYMLGYNSLHFPLTK